MSYVEGMNLLNGAQQFFEAAQRTMGSPKGVGFFGLALEYLSDFFALPNIPADLIKRGDILRTEIQKMTNFDLAVTAKTDSFGHSNSVQRRDTVAACEAAVQAAIDQYGTQNPALLPLLTSALTSLVAEHGTLTPAEQCRSTELCKQLQSLIGSCQPIGVESGFSFGRDSTSYSQGGGVSYGMAFNGPLPEMTYQDSCNFEMQRQQYINAQRGQQ